MYFHQLISPIHSKEPLAHSAYHGLLLNHIINVSYEIFM